MVVRCREGGRRRGGAWVEVGRRRVEEIVVRRAAKNPNPQSYYIFMYIDEMGDVRPRGLSLHSCRLQFKERCWMMVGDDIACFMA